MVSAVERCGASRAEFLALARIDPGMLESAEARVDLEDYLRALEAALMVTKNPALGLHLGQHASASMYHVVAHLAEHAATLGDAIDISLRYSSILAVGFEPCLVDEGELVAWRLPYLTGEHNAVRLTAEFALAGFMRLLRQYLGEAVRPARVCFAYRAPAHADQYRKLFAGTECFEQPFTEIKFPRAWLERPQLYANRELYTLLRSHADQELTRLAHGVTMAARVQQLLAATDPCQLPTMDAVARKLDLSARTLARKLQAEGVAFTQLIEHRRSKEAKCLLAGGRLTIQEVANKLGFADTPAFHKAFRRWTGLTPKQYVASASR